ncbi:MAG: PadR family transcriptional regulator [Chloroflexi bacterium]|nr:PadR family transcriptional regulator [Chloroflexota bacterium]
MDRELLLLGLLKRQKMHGYELHDFIEKYMQMCVDLKKSTAYYLLDKLANNGFIDQTEERHGNRPPRQVYRITEKGNLYFSELLAQNLAAYTPARFGNNVGLAFLDEISHKDALPLLNTRLEKLIILLDTAKQVPPHPGSMQFVIDHQVDHLQTEMEWLKNVILRLSINT